LKKKTPQGPQPRITLEIEYRGEFEVIFEMGFAKKEETYRRNN
jgi:hypothetical protein